jgi:HEAT repeat protein
MNIPDILNDKQLKPKEKTEIISSKLSDKVITIDQLLDFATNAKDADKATCIEAIEYLSQKNPGMINEQAFRFVTQSLTGKAPRVKWESARVIGNTAFLFPENLDMAIQNLLFNTEHSGTVVRWSAAFALGRIVMLRLAINGTLVPAIESIIAREDKKSIRKIYQDALKKTLK